MSGSQLVYGADGENRGCLQFLTGGSLDLLRTVSQALRPRVAVAYGEHLAPVRMRDIEIHTSFSAHRPLWLSLPRSGPLPSQQQGSFGETKAGLQFSDWAVGVPSPVDMRELDSNGRNSHVSQASRSRIRNAIKEKWRLGLARGLSR